MDEDRAREVWERSAALLADADDMNTRLAQRRAARAAEWGSASDGFTTPEPAAPTQGAPQAAVRRGRNWGAEADWVRSIIDQHLGTRKALADAVGKAIGRLLDSEVIPLAEEIGQDLARLDKRINAQQAVLDALRAEFTASLGALRTELLTADANRIRECADRMLAGFDRIERLLKGQDQGRPIINIEPDPASKPH